MAITTTVTTSSNGTTTTVDVHVNDEGPPRGQRHVDVILSFDPTQLEFDEPDPTGYTDLDATRMKVWWKELLTGGGHLDFQVNVKPKADASPVGSSMGTLVVLDPDNSDMVSQVFYVVGASLVPSP